MQLSNLITPETQNIITLAPNLSRVLKIQQLGLFIKQNQSITKKRSGSNLIILFYNDAGETKTITTGPGEHEIELNGNFLQFSIEDKDGLAGTPNYISSFDIQIHDIITISLNH